jgi:phage FluMu gp28-like protein
MQIANPIYDSVFKYRLEDNEIARGVLEVMLGTPIRIKSTKNSDDTLMHRMAQRLRFAITDEDLQRIMEIEDKVAFMLLDWKRKYELRNQEPAQKNQTLEAQRQRLKDLAPVQAL